MRAAVPVKADALPSVCQRKVVTTNPTGAKTECLFADGTSILVSNFLASVMRAGDELLFPRSEEHTSELQSLTNLVCRLLLEKKKKKCKDRNKTKTTSAYTIKQTDQYGR